MKKGYETYVRIPLSGVGIPWPYDIAPSVAGNGAEGALQHGKGPRLYVGGINPAIHKDDIKAHFSKWGKVLDVHFPGTSCFQIHCQE